MGKPYTLPLSILALLVGCSHGDELDDIENARMRTTPPAPTPCLPEIKSPLGASEFGVAQDADPAQPGVQLDVNVVLAATCTTGPLEFGLCTRSANGVEPPAVFQGTIDTVVGGSSHTVRVTLTEAIGVQTPCVRRELVGSVDVERVCEGSEALCNGETMCRANTDRDAAHCGASCKKCEHQGDHGTDSCVAGACVVTCDDGYHFEAGACRLRPSCKALASCSGGDCCASDLVSADGAPVRFVRGFDASGNGLGIQEFQPASAPQVSLDPFYLDRYEVTVGRFRRFVDGYETFLGGANPKPGRGANPRVPTSGWQTAWNALKYPTSAGAEDALPRSRADLIAQITLPECAGSYTWSDAPGDRESLPINCVNFYQAFLFCIWDGESSSSRLPSEAEWNAAAAGGGQQRAYPWSPRDNPGSLAIDGFADYGKMDRYPYPVGMHANGAGLWGTLDLGGNVYEWTRDTGMPLASDPVTGKLESPYKQTGSDPIWLEDDVLGTSYRALRGGSFKHIDCGSCDPKVKLRTSSRVLLEGFSVYNDLGFRCARNY